MTGPGVKTVRRPLIGDDHGIILDHYGCDLRIPGGKPFPSQCPCYALANLNAGSRALHDDPLSLQLRSTTLIHDDAFCRQDAFGHI